MVEACAERQPEFASLYGRVTNLRKFRVMTGREPELEENCYKRQSGLSLLHLNHFVLGPKFPFLRRFDLNECLDGIRRKIAYCIASAISQTTVQAGRLVSAREQDG